MLTHPCPGLCYLHSPKERPRWRRMALDWYRVKSPSWNLGSCPYSWGVTQLLEVLSSAALTSVLPPQGPAPAPMGYGYSHRRP